MATLHPSTKLLALGLSILPAASAQAGWLSMRFAGGASEVTLTPGGSATIEVRIDFNFPDAGSNRVTWMDARFDVGSLLPGVGDNYVADGASHLTVVGVAPGPYPNWSAADSSGVGGPFNSDFSLSVGDPNGLSGPMAASHQPWPPMAFVTVRLEEAITADTYIVFQVAESLPLLRHEGSLWDHRFQEFINGPQQFQIAQGNPGDADPRWAYHGYESLRPLIIHSVPEPCALALVALAGIHRLMRRRPRGAELPIA